MPFEPRPLLLVSNAEKRKKFKPLLLAEGRLAKIGKHSSTSSVGRNPTIPETKDTVTFKSKPLKSPNIVNEKEIMELMKKRKDLKVSTEELSKDTSDFLKAIHSNEMDVKKIRELVRKYPELLNKLKEKDILFGRIKGQDILERISLQQNSLKELTEDGLQTTKEKLIKQEETYQQEREEEWLKMSHLPGGWRDENFADLHKKKGDTVMETDNLVEPAMPGAWKEELLTTDVEEGNVSTMKAVVSHPQSFGGLYSSLLSLKSLAWGKMCCTGK
jgi:hypothetical protein